MPIRSFCHDAAQINTFLMVIFGNDAMEKFYVCLGTSFRFHKKAWSTDRIYIYTLSGHW